MRIVLTVTLVLALPAIALACLHAGGAGNTQPVTQSGQQGIVVHANGIEDLVLQVDYQGLATQKIGWIVPVPASPTDYGVGDLQVFRDVGEWVNLRREQPQPRSRSRSLSHTAATQAPLRFGEPARVGPFDIQPIQGAGPGAAEALNAWMRDNEFQPLPVQTLSYYVQRSWTFLAIRATPEEGGELASAGGLPPLRITFPSERAVYPLKLSTHMGVMPVRVYLFTARALRAEAFAGARARGFEVATAGIHLRHDASRPGTLRSDVGAFDVASAPATLRPLLTRLGARAHLAVLLNETFNAEPRAGVEMRAAHWAEDLAVPGTGDGEVLAGARSGSDAEAEAEAEADSEAEAEAEANSEAEAEAETETETSASAMASPTEEASGGCSVGGAPHFAGWLAWLLLWERSRRRRP